MIHDPVNEVTAITIQTSQFIHFQIRFREVASNSIEFIVTNWNKSGHIYCKLGKGDSIFVAYS